LANSPEHEKTTICNSTCYALNKRCVVSEYNQSCSYAPIKNCYGEGNIPRGAKVDPDDGLLGGLPIDNMTAVGILCGAVVLACACLFCCARNQMGNDERNVTNNKYQTNQTNCMDKFDFSMVMNVCSFLYYYFDDFIF
jgi:hypothetical protein